MAACRLSVSVVCVCVFLSWRFFSLCVFGRLSESSSLHFFESSRLLDHCERQLRFNPTQERTHNHNTTTQQQKKATSHKHKRDTHARRAQYRLGVHEFLLPSSECWSGRRLQLARIPGVDHRHTTTHITTATTDNNLIYNIDPTLIT